MHPGSRDEFQGPFQRERRQAKDDVDDLEDWDWFYGGV